MTIAIIASFQVIVNRCSQNNFEIVVIMNKMTSKTLILSVFGVVLRENSAYFSLFFRRVVYSTKVFRGEAKNKKTIIKKEKKSCAKVTKRASLS